MLGFVGLLCWFLQLLSLFSHLLSHQHLEDYLTAVSALQVIQQSTSLDLGWEDNSPIIWEPIDFLRELSDINLRLISPPLGDLLDLKTLDLHNTSLAGEIQNLESLQHVEKLYARITCWQQFSTENKILSSLCCSQ
nr:probable LRR receptor-like serine/threonine-protein kinase At5g48740 isoform X1 [Populus alba]